MRRCRRAKPNPDARGEIASQRVMGASHAHEQRSIERRLVFDFNFDIRQQTECGKVLERRRRFQRDARNRRAGSRRAIGKRVRGGGRCFAARAGNRIAVRASFRLAELTRQLSFGFRRNGVLEFVCLFVRACPIQTEHIGEKSFGEAMPAQQGEGTRATGIRERERSVGIDADQRPLNEGVQGRVDFEGQGIREVGGG